MGSSQVVFDSAAMYVTAVDTNKDRLTRVRAIITALYEVAIKAAETGNIQEYQLDSGQTKIKTLYTGAEQVYKSIKAFETLETQLLNKLNGRNFRLMDSKNFIR